MTWKFPRTLPGIEQPGTFRLLTLAPRALCNLPFPLKVVVLFSQLYKTIANIIAHTYICTHAYAHTHTHTHTHTHNTFVHVGTTLIDKKEVCNSDM